MPLALVCALALLLTLATPARASFQTDVAGRVNEARASEGLDALTQNSDIDAVAQAWAEHLAEVGELGHNPLYWSQIPAGAWAAAENVAYNSRPTAAAMHGQLMDSSGHRANILGDHTHIGVGYAVDGEGGGWLVEVFGRYPDPLPGDRDAPAPEPSSDPEPSATPDPTTAPTSEAGDEETDPSGPPPARVPAGWLASGSSGPEVLALQTDLATLGYELTPDGDFGDVTRARVAEFQRDAGLEPDGLVGPATLSAIDEALAAAAATADPPEDETTSEETPSSTAPTTEPASSTVTPDIVPTDAARPPSADGSPLPSVPALASVLGGAGAVLGALLMIRRRIATRQHAPRHG